MEDVSEDGDSVSMWKEWFVSANYKQTVLCYCAGLQVSFYVSDVREAFRRAYTLGKVYICSEV